MSIYGDTIDQAIAALPKKKDGDWTGGKTCRSLIYDAIGDAAYASIKGGPWAVEVEVALHKLCLAVDDAIDSDSILKEIFDRPRDATTFARSVLRREPVAFDRAFAEAETLADVVAENEREAVRLGYPNLISKQMEGAAEAYPDIMFGKASKEHDEKSSPRKPHVDNDDDFPF
jgi:hypothetical protein